MYILKATRQIHAAFWHPVRRDHEFGTGVRGLEKTHPTFSPGLLFRLK